MHNIDLKKYEIRTDMMVDLVEDKNEIKSSNYVKNGVKVSFIKLDENNSFGKKKGNYLTLEFDDVTDADAKDTVSEVFKEELKRFLKVINYDKSMKTCVIGLGNMNSTPDSLGPLVCNDIIVTNHFNNLGISLDDKLSIVSCFSPGVTGSTGIETSDYVKGVVNMVKPDIVLVVDALSSSSVSRVNKSIQITDSGISPGSGIGNKRKEISKEELGIPVIVIGVPTVTSATTIVSDTINYMIKNYSYNKKLSSKKVSKFITKPVNYLKDDVDTTNVDKTTLLGLVGSLNEDELKNLVYEVLTPIGYNLMVTPKEVDFVVENLSKVISYGINHTLHNI